MGTVDVNELRILTNKALGKPETFVYPEGAVWDSLDQLEIITHLNDVLGDEVNDIDALNDFKTLDALADILRQEGMLK